MVLKGHTQLRLDIFSFQIYLQIPLNRQLNNFKQILDFLRFYK